MSFSVQTPRFLPNPPVYYCPRAAGKLTLTGDIRKPFWVNVPFTEPFVDISGTDFPAPRFRTRAKLCWDDENLYIGAMLEGSEIWATIDKRDSVMYYDNDFEVFIDPSSSTHDYMELEMNAKNTQWDLMLTRPYRDGGRSVSGWDMKGLRTAVHIEGTLNDPNADNRFWSVEIVIPFRGLMETYSLEENPPELERCYPPRHAPRVGEFWRMNFSRVQWTVDEAYRKQCRPDGTPLPEDNWVWAPTGLIDIHCPEHWGFVFFTGDGTPLPIPENELRKLYLREIYYAQFRDYAQNGHFSDDLSALGCAKKSYPVRIETTSRTFILSCPGECGGTVVLRSDGYTYVDKESW